MKTQELFNLDVDIDPKFLGVKDLVELPKPNKADEKLAEELLAMTDEFLSDEEKERRARLGYKSADEIRKDRAYREADEPVAEYGGAVAAAKIDDRTNKLRLAYMDESDGTANADIGYFGIDFHALRKHNHTAEKDAHSMADADHSTHKHSAHTHEKKDGYGKGMHVHKDNGHFHADGTYHTGGHGSEHDHGQKGHSYNHACSGCNPGYASDNGMSLTLGKFLFMPRAA